MSSFAVLVTSGIEMHGNSRGDYSPGFSISGPQDVKDMIDEALREKLSSDAKPRWADSGYLWKGEQKIIMVHDILELFKQHGWKLEHTMSDDGYLTFVFCRN